MSCVPESVWTTPDNSQAPIVDFHLFDVQQVLERNGGQNNWDFSEWRRRISVGRFYWHSLYRQKCAAYGISTPCQDFCLYRTKIPPEMTNNRPQTECPTIFRKRNPLSLESMGNLQISYLLLTWKMKFQLPNCPPVKANQAHTI